MQLANWIFFAITRVIAPDYFYAVARVIAPDYSSNGLHYNLKERATRDAILGQKSDIIGINASKRNQKQVSFVSIKRYLAEGGGDLLRLDSRGKGEPLLKLLRDETLTSFCLRLVLRQNYQHIPLRLDAQLLWKIWFCISLFDQCGILSSLSSEDTFSNS